MLIPRTYVCVLGAGQFGTAVAIHLAKKGYDTTLWGRNENTLAKWQKDWCAKNIFPNINFPKNLKITSNFDNATSNINIIVVGVPTQHIREILRLIKKSNIISKHAPAHPFMLAPKLLVCVNKGIEIKTGQLTDEIILEELGENWPFCVISGPSFAYELVSELPMALVCAGKDAQNTIRCQNILASSYLRVYRTIDLIGVELGGAIKNVMAIAVGICDGLMLGQSARASLISRALAEMMRIAKAYGANPITISGLSGLGDLVLCATSTQSRNYRLGTLIAKGMPPGPFFMNPQFLAEGAYTAKAILPKIKKFAIEAPIIEEVYNVLWKNTPPTDAIAKLLGRSLKPEDPFLASNTNNAL